MGGDTRPYVVRQGDYLEKIAARTGFRADDIWALPENDPLRRAGRSKDVLHPGDVIHVPDGARPARDVTIGGENAYVGTIQVVPVRIVFRIGAEPRARQAYEVKAAGETIASGQTDGEGAITFEVPVDVMEVTVSFADPFACYAVRIGHVDPVEERSGVAGRLRQLGYLPRDAPPSDEEVIDAIGRFQEEHGIAVTREPDGDTRARLVREFGS